MTTTVAPWSSRVWNTPRRVRHVQGMQADGGLVKDEDGVRLAPAHLAGQLQPLGFPAGEAGGGLPQGQVPQPQVRQHLQPLADELPVPAGRQGRVDVHGHQLGQGVGRRPVLGGVGHLVGFLISTGCPGRSGQGMSTSGQELHVQADAAGAVAGGAAEPAGVVGKVPRLVPQGFGRRGSGKDLPQLVVDVGVGGHGGADVDADGGGVDEL